MNVLNHVVCVTYWIRVYDIVKPDDCTVRPVIERVFGLQPKCETIGCEGSEFASNCVLIQRTTCQEYR